MSKDRILLVVLALIGTLVGGVLGFLAAPQGHQYKATANVALLPAPNLTTVEASNFWEVLTHGQVSRTAAVVYEDPRWLASAANAAKVSPDDLILSAAALPETTLVAVTVMADSPGAAETALNDVLNTATPEVTSLASPYYVKVLWSPKGSVEKEPVPGGSQIAAAGALGGLLVGGALGWLVVRRQRRDVVSGGTADEVVLPRS